MAPPQCMCYLNTHKLHLGRISLAWHSPWMSTTGTCKSACSMSGQTDHVWVTTMERLDQGHLHPLLEHPRLTHAWPGIECRPPRWEVSTLAMSYSNSLLIAIQNIYTTTWAPDRTKNKKDSVLHNMNWYRRKEEEHKLDRIWKKQKLCRRNVICSRNSVA